MGLRHFDSWGNIRENQPNTPPPIRQQKAKLSNMLFVFDEGVRVSQGPPPWLDQSALTEPAMELTRRGYSTLCISPFEQRDYEDRVRESGKPHIELNMQQHAVYITLPKAKSPAQTGRNVLKLLRSTVEHIDHLSGGNE